MLFQVGKIYKLYGLNRLLHFVSRKLRQIASLDNHLLVRQEFLQKASAQIKRVIE